VGAYESECILYIISCYISSKLGLLTSTGSAATSFNVLWNSCMHFVGNFIRFLTVKEFFKDRLTSDRVRSKIKIGTIFTAHGVSCIERWLSLMKMCILSAISKGRERVKVGNVRFSPRLVNRCSRSVVCQSVCLPRASALQKRLNKSSSCLACKLLGTQGRFIVLDGGADLIPHDEGREIRCGLRQITLATCYYYHRNYQSAKSTTFVNTFTICCFMLQQSILYACKLQSRQPISADRTT